MKRRCDRTLGQHRRRRVPLPDELRLRHGLGPPGAVNARSVLHSESILYGVFVWARTALSCQQWRFLARAVHGARRTARAVLRRRVRRRACFVCSPTQPLIQPYIPTGMRGPACIFWTDLTPFSPQGRRRARRRAAVVLPAVLLRSGPTRGGQAPLAFTAGNRFCVAVLCARGGRLTALFGILGFGQWTRTTATSRTSRATTSRRTRSTTRARAGGDTAIPGMLFGVFCIVQLFTCCLQQIAYCCRGAGGGGHFSTCMQSLGAYGTPLSPTSASASAPASQPAGRACADPRRRARARYTTCGSSNTFVDCPGPPGAFKRPSRFPQKIDFLWRFCMRMQGA
jgi:hypothetical protein